MSIYEAQGWRPRSLTVILEQCRLELKILLRWGSPEPPGFSAELMTPTERRRFFA
jgi:hypothetical protein